MRNLLRQIIFHKKATVLSGKQRESAGFVNSTNFFRVSWLSQLHPLTEFLLHTCGMSDSKCIQGSTWSIREVPLPQPRAPLLCPCYPHGHTWLRKLNCQQGLTEKLDTFWFLFLDNADLAVYATAESNNKSSNVFRSFRSNYLGIQTEGAYCLVGVF